MSERLPNASGASAPTRTEPGDPASTPDSRQSAGAVRRHAAGDAGLDALDPIVRAEGVPVVSVYVPFDRTPTELHASRLRIEAHMRRARHRLHERGASESAIDATLDRLHAACPALEDLSSRTRALVWLSRDTQTDFFESVEALPSRVVVSDAPALRPLLRSIARSPRFRVLAVSETRVQAFEGDVVGLRPIDVPGAPKSLVDALGGELDGARARALSHRSDRPVPGRAGNAPVYHGHGGAPEEREIDRDRFHRVLGAAITKAWRTSSRPVVLAAEERTGSALREHLALPALLADTVRGHPDDASTETLHARALESVRARLEALRQADAASFDRSRAAGKAAPGDRLDELVEVAIAGRIRRLWVEGEAAAPGRIDAARGHWTESDDPDDDVLDGLVCLTLARGGEVRVVEAGETPTGAPACAELR